MLIDQNKAVAVNHTTISPDTHHSAIAPWNYKLCIGSTVILCDSDSRVHWIARPLTLWSYVQFSIFLTDFKKRVLNSWASFFAIAHGYWLSTIVWHRLGTVYACYYNIYLTVSRVSKSMAIRIYLSPNKHRSNRRIRTTGYVCNILQYQYQRLYIFSRFFSPLPRKFSFSQISRNLKFFSDNKYSMSEMCYLHKPHGKFYIMCTYYSRLFGMYITFKTAKSV